MDCNCSESCYTPRIPVPSTQELFFLVIAIFALWFVLKLAKLAIRVILFLITVAIVMGVVWHFFLR